MNMNRKKISAKKIFINGRTVATVAAATKVPVMKP